MITGSKRERHTRHVLSILFSRSLLTGTQKPQRRPTMIYRESTALAQLESKFFERGAKAKKFLRLKFTFLPWTGTFYIQFLRGQAKRVFGGTWHLQSSLRLRLWTQWISGSVRPGGPRAVVQGGIGGRIKRPVGLRYELAPVVLERLVQLRADGHVLPGHVVRLARVGEQVEQARLAGRAR